MGGISSLVLLWVSLFLLSSQVLAFEYKVHDQELLKPSATELLTLQNHFARAGFHNLGALRSFSQAGYRFDQAYTDGSLNQAILLKSGLSVPAQQEGQIITDSKLGVHALHFRVNGMPYLALALGMTASEFSSAVKPWIKKSSARMTPWWLSTAHAEEICTPTPSTAKELSTLTNQVEQESILRNIGRCAVDAFQGAKNSVAGTLDFFKTLATNPSALWKEMQESYVALKEMALNIRAELNSAFAVMKNLSPEEKSTIACTIGGELVTSLGQSLLVAGGVAKLMPQILLKLKTATELMKSLSSAEAKGLRLADKSALYKEVLSCGI